MRLRDRVAIVVGAGQSPGEGIGNGRATALTFAREGARVLAGGTPRLNSRRR
jgi:NAD(P)-dependent dehydrogenase (short-subunit alcohol dehydrogenase family)